MIEGVVIKELVTHNDERGFFREVFRVREEKIDIGQLSHSLVKQGVVKAWHGHKKQTQWNYVTRGQIKVALYDSRPESKTYRQIMEFVVGENETPKVYFFPVGVLHGYQCVRGPMHIIYLTSGTYDPMEEVRVDLNDPMIGYKWK